MWDAAGHGPALVYLSNPSNPVGTLIRKAELARFVAELPQRVSLVLDEAYHEYAVGDPEYTSLLEQTSDHPNVIVTRTFSKVHGMAGLRIGYGVAHATTAQRLRSCAIHHNANHLSVYAALASLGDGEHVARSLRANADTMAFVTSALDELDLAHLPSRTNFVTHQIRGDVSEYVARMRDERIWVGRPFPPLDGWNRLSIGSRADMEQFVDTLRLFRERGWV
jgi:histidinol-phosphate aminotransferase